ncbi:MAG: peptidylprolyl isomerase [Rhodospirillaceae bacterium]|nr:peptidylprolyl isomerase [Rhodospirillaceae bacterium]
MMLVRALAATAAIVCGATSLAAPAAAQDRTGRGIVAIVNRDAITRYDLEQRLKLVGLGSRIPQGGEARQRLIDDVLRSMINERLQLQEATRQSIQVTDKEVEEQVSGIEQRNRMPRGGLAKALRQRGIDPRTFEDQVRSSIAWSKVVQRDILPQIRVSDAEVQTVLNRLRANKDKLQYRVQEIFLAVESPAQQGKVLQTANTILGHLRSGASFELLARQFSQTGTASAGGDLGFLFEGQMEPEIEKVVKQMKTGQVAGPIRGVGGYYIVRLADRRSFGGRNPDLKAIAVARATIAVPAKSTPAQRKALEEKLVKATVGAQTCDALIKAAQASGGGGQLVREVVLDQQRPQIRTLIAPLKINQKSRPFFEGGIVSIYMRCPDNEAGQPPDEKAVREALMRQKLGAFADRYLKELRRSAYVDIRI